MVCNEGEEMMISSVQGIVWPPAKCYRTLPLSDAGTCVNTQCENLCRSQIKAVDIGTCFGAHKCLCAFTCDANRPPSFHFK